jgi:hypothetical protein
MTAVELETMGDLKNLKDEETDEELAKVATSFLLL